jgi:hypothetical protein
MQSKLFQRFHHAAEAAGYPALLVVSVAALSAMVATISLLALVRSGWALALALLTLLVACLVVAAETMAAFSDRD